MKNKNRFMGHEVSSYGQEHGWVDYKTLAEAVGDMVLANDLIVKTDGVIGYWEIENVPELEDDEDCYPEIFQWYIITEKGAELLSKWTDEFVYYNDELDMYLWGVTHFGTSWDYVLTNIKIEEEEE